MTTISQVIYYMTACSHPNQLYYYSKTYINHIPIQSDYISMTTHSKHSEHDSGNRAGEHMSRSRRRSHPGPQKYDYLYD